MVRKAAVDRKAVWSRLATAASSKSGARYNLAYNRANGTIGCSCKGWIFKHTCPHLDDLLRSLRLKAVTNTQALDWCVPGSLIERCFNTPYPTPELLAELDLETVAGVLTKMGD
jgi:hypothetical protein